MEDQQEVIRDAIERAGGKKAVAAALKMSEEGVRIWISRGKIPAERVVEVEHITGVPREKLRPDLYERRANTQQAAWDGRFERRRTNQMS